MGKKNITKSDVVVSAEQLIAGTEKHLAKTAQAAFAGSSFTPDQITSNLQSLVTLRADVDAAKATVKAKLAKETTAMPALIAFKNAFVAYVKVAYGTSPDVLADFGINPKTRAQPTVVTKAAAAAKSAATRSARHTMGTKQKKGIKGAVTGVLVTPITAAAPTVTAPSNPTAPATSVGPTVASSTAPATSVGPAAATPHTA